MKNEGRLQPFASAFVSLPLALMLLAACTEARAAESELGEPRPSTRFDSRLRTYMMTKYPDSDVYRYVERWSKDKELVLIYRGTEAKSRLNVARATVKSLDVTGTDALVMAGQIGEDDSLETALEEVRLSGCSVDAAAGAPEVFPVLWQTIARHNIAVYQELVAITKKRIRNFEELVYDLGNDHQADDLRREREQLKTESAELAKWERWQRESYARIRCARMEPPLKGTDRRSQS